MFFLSNPDSSNKLNKAGTPQKEQLRKKWLEICIIIFCELCNKIKMQSFHYTVLYCIINSNWYNIWLSL